MFTKKDFKKRLKRDKPKKEAGLLSDYDLGYLIAMERYEHLIFKKQKKEYIGMSEENGLRLLDVLKKANDKYIKADIDAMTLNIDGCTFSNKQSIKIPKGIDIDSIIQRQEALDNLMMEWLLKPMNLK